MAIVYREAAAGLRPEQLAGGFFAGWPHHPDPAAHLRLLQASWKVWLALDAQSPGPPVVGFITAVGDEVLSAYIPLLEVLPPYRGQGIGRELVARMLATLEGLYMVDLSCDADRVGFYERLGFQRGVAMLRRSYTHQAGRPAAAPSGGAD